MYLENLTSSEMERIAYLTGDTMASRAFGEFADNAADIESLESDIDNALDLVSCAGERGKELYASMLELSQAGETTKTLTTAMLTIATCYQHPAPRQTHTQSARRDGANNSGDHRLP